MLFHMTMTGEEGGGGRLSNIKDLKRKANSLSRDTRQASALGFEGEVGVKGAGEVRFFERKTFIKSTATFSTVCCQTK